VLKNRPELTLREQVIEHASVRTAEKINISQKSVSRIKKAILFDLSQFI
jgi:hypothetical protein